jgi:hypothetical protein
MLADWQIARKIHKTVIRSFQVSIETTSRRVARLPERGQVHPQRSTLSPWQPPVGDGRGEGLPDGPDLL